MDTNEKRKRECREYHNLLTKFPTNQEFPRLPRHVLPSQCPVNRVTSELSVETFVENIESRMN
jgi:hypothetical protein